MPGQSGVELFLLAEPVGFSDAVMLPVGGGRYRIADRTRRHWPDPPSLEFRRDGVWKPTWAEEVDRLTGTVAVPDAPAGAAVRATGRFLPLARIGGAEGWKLNLGFVGAGSLDGGSSAFSGAQAQLHRVQLDPDYKDSYRGPLLALLAVTGDGGRYEAVGQLLGGEIPIAAHELVLAIDAGALIYTDA